MAKTSSSSAALRFDFYFTRDANALFQIAHFHDFDVRAGLRGNCRKIGVQIKHPRIGVPEETDAGSA